MILKLIIYLFAHCSNRKYWRVKYDNEPRFTRLLSKSEAKGLAECFEGKAWIDFDHIKKDYVRLYQIFRR